MTILNTDNWKKDESLEGLLFFAQIIEDMVSRYTIDSYKAPVLNTHSLCDELLDAYEEVEQGFLHPKALDPIKEELVWNLKNDSVAKNILGYKYNSFIFELDKNSDYRGLYSIINILKNLLDEQYIDQLKNELTEKVKNPKNKEDILNLTKIFVSELASQGYSQEYIHQIVMHFFFSSLRISNCSQIGNFFSRFSLEYQNWDVYFKGDRNFLFLKDIALLYDLEVTDETPMPRRGHQSEVDYFSYDEQYPVYLYFKNVDGLDPFNASKKCEAILQRFKDLSILSAHKQRLSWKSKSFVYSKTDYYQQIEDFSSMLKIKDSEISDIKYNIDETIPLIVNFHDPHSQYFISSSLNLHSIAVESKNPENQLMNLWTALETLLPPPSNEEKRIIHFLDSYEPFLGRKYIQKLIYDLLVELRFELGDQLEVIFSEMPSGLSNFEKCALLVSDEEFCEQFRDKLYKIIENNLRLRNKIFSLMKNLNNSEKILTTIELHNKRVRWQLQRIYRARNLIVHKGGKLLYIDQLVENLHSYYHSIMNLIREIQDDYSVDSLNSVFKLLEIEHKAHVILLKNSKKTDCDQTNFKVFLFCKIDQ